MLRVSFLSFRPITSINLQQARRTSSVVFTKREFLDHFSHLKVGSIFSPKEMNHILGLLPAMLQKAVINNSQEILVSDKKFSGIDAGRTVYERVIPKSFEQQLDLLISRDSVLRDSIKKQSYEDGKGARYFINLV